MGGFGGPLARPIVWVTVKENEAFLNAELTDAGGSLVLQIKENTITINKDNIYAIELYPENQIPPDRVVVTNQYGETALDLRREGTIWDFNGDFYHKTNHIVATPEGTTINPYTPRV
jgi:hypothetical protein